MYKKTTQNNKTCNVLKIDCGQRKDLKSNFKTYIKSCEWIELGGFPPKPAQMGKGPIFGNSTGPRAGYV